MSRRLVDAIQEATGSPVSSAWPRSFRRFLAIKRGALPTRRKRGGVRGRVPATTASWSRAAARLLVLYVDAPHMVTDTRDRKGISARQREATAMVVLDYDAADVLIGAEVICGLPDTRDPQGSRPTGPDRPAAGGGDRHE